MNDTRGKTFSVPALTSQYKKQGISIKKSYTKTELLEAYCCLLKCDWF